MHLQKASLQLLKHELLFKDFQEPPRELSSEDIQLAIDFLIIPENATNFINFNSIPKSDEIRDRWLERHVGVTIINAWNKE
jgi:hypothetical protein